MSAQSNANGPAPAYDDAEKGTAEVIVSPTELTYRGEKKETEYPKDEKKDPFARDEKKDLAAVNVFPNPSVKKDTVPAPKPAPKPKKKVSKWILWQLWFNTYRYVLDPCTYVIE